MCRPVQINVAMTAYLLTVAVLIPGSGWLSDRFGARSIFSLAIVLFTLASIGCAIAPTLTALTVARVVQGIGGAMMVPVGRLIVLRTTAKVDLIKAIAYLTWPALVAPVLAPPLGGLISTYTSWRWIFLINVPLGVIGLIFARRLVPDVRADRAAPAGLARIPADRGRGGGPGDRSRADRHRAGGLGLRRHRPGVGRADPGRRHRLPAEDTGTAVGSAHAEDPQLAGRRRRRHRLPVGDQRHPVPAAVVLPARLRMDGSAGRRHRHRAVPGKPVHQAVHHPADAPPGGSAMCCCWRCRCRRWR